MQDVLNELLTKAKDLLKGEMTNISYETWIKNLEIESFTNDKITLIATSPFQKEAVETRYYDLVVNTFKFLTNKDCKISIICKEDFISNNSLDNFSSKQDTIDTTNS